jgi:haloalkane dehalogenase
MRLFRLILVSVCMCSFAASACSEKTSPEVKNEKKTVDVLGKKIAYTETGEGDPIVFIHGNPTSSYLWRNVIPHVEGLGRCIAPDLIGMGDSEKLPPSDGPERYSFPVSYRYFEAFLEAIGATKNVTLVLHDWGGAHGFHWASQHPDAVKGVAYMETFVTPLVYSDYPEAYHQHFKDLKTDKGIQMIIEENQFIEMTLPSAILRPLTEEEMDHYRAPYVKDKQDRQVMLNWAALCPFDARPAGISKVMIDYSAWLESPSVPKLFINAEPGGILTGRIRELVRTFPNQTEVTVKGVHFIQEDSPHEIGAALKDFIKTIDEK